MIATVAVEYHALVVVIAALLAPRGLGPAVSIPLRRRGRDLACEAAQEAHRAEGDGEERSTRRGRVGTPRRTPGTPSLLLGA